MENGLEEKRFTIPTRDDDLLEENDDFYTVELQPTLEEIEAKISHFRRHIEVDNWKCILDYFDYFFYCIRFKFEGEPWQYRVQLLPSLTKGLSQVLDSAESLLRILVGANGDSINDEAFAKEREQHLRAVQMYLYLLCRIGVMFETEALIKQKDATFAASKKGGRKAQLGDTAKTFVDKWIAERDKVLDVLLKMTTMEFEGEDGQHRYGAIRFLWLPPIVCPNFIRVVKDFAFKLLENPELCKVSSRHWLYAIFELLHAIAVYFDDYSKVGAKLVFLMKHLEYLAAPSLSHSPFVEAIEVVSRKDDMDPVLLAMLSALGRFSGTDFARNEVSARPFGLFVTTLAEKKPLLLNQNVVHIAPFLSEDQATLRCAVLTAFYEIVTRVYQGNLPEGPARQNRDKLLLCLQDHILDVNAVVRSKALQLWARLARSSRIPLTFIHNCLIQDASCRLLDKSVFVRRNAATFLSTFLDFNPFGPSLASDDLKEKLNKAYAEYNEVKKLDPECDMVKAAMSEWEEIQEFVLKNIGTVVQKLKTEEMRVDDDLEDFVDGPGGINAKPAEAETESSTEAEAEKNNDEQPDYEGFLSGRWQDAVVPLLEKEETRGAVIEVFVKAVFAGKVSDITVDGSCEEITKRLHEKLMQSFLEKNVTRRLTDNEEQILEQDKIEDFNAKLAVVEKKVKFCQEALIFAVEMEGCLQAALRSIMTGQANELAESIKLIVEANKFGIKGSQKAIRELFRVVWKRDNAIQDVLVAAAKDLLVSTNEKRSLAMRKTVENLFKTMLGVSAEERVSIEQVIYLMVQRDMLETELFDLVAEVMFSTCGSLRIAALRLFSIICKAKKEYMRERFDVFLELSRREGLFEGDDGALAAEFCNLISVFGGLPKTKNVLTLSETPFRLPESHSIFECIHTLLVHGFTVSEYRWLEVLTKALNAIFYVDAEPTTRVTRIAGDLVRICKVVLAEAIKMRKLHDELSVDRVSDSGDAAEMPEFDYAELITREGMQTPNSEGRRDGTEECPDIDGAQTPALSDEELHKELLSQLRSQLATESENATALWDTVAERLCYFAGEVALKLLIHVDISFVAEMKRKNEVLHLLRTAAKDAATLAVLKSVHEFPEDRVPTTLEEDSIKRLGLFEASESEHEDRLGLTGMSEEERIVQRAQQICETDLLQSDALLGRLVPFLFSILEIKKAFGRERVRSAAALALAKMMLLSSDLCGRAMPMFLDCLANSASSLCRSNLMVAAGDICFRFPNIVEGCSEHLYNRIRDKDDYVRQTCIIVLTHLILNDMIKVRTSIADLAKCTIDEDDNVAELANILFAELSKKGNIIYNLMPDMISRLSADDDVTLDEFMSIMKKGTCVVVTVCPFYKNVSEVVYVGTKAVRKFLTVKVLKQPGILLSYIKKDKQSDNLLEKLCARLETCIDQNGIVDERLAERISFCISRLPLSDKFVGILSEHLPALAHLLHLDSVYTNLQSAISSFKRTTIRNAELRSELDDLLEELNKLRYEKTDQEELADKAFNHARKKAQKTPRRASIKKKK